MAPKGKSGEAENKDEEDEEGEGRFMARKMVRAEEEEIDDLPVVIGGGGLVLNVEQEQGTEDGPEAIGAVADGVTKSEIFPQSKHGDESEGNGDDRGGSKEDDDNDRGHEDEGGEDAREGHG